MLPVENQVVISTTPDSGKPSVETLSYPRQETLDIIRAIDRIGHERGLRRMQNLLEPLLSTLAGVAADYQHLFLVPHGELLQLPLQKMLLEKLSSPPSISSLPGSALLGSFALKPPRLSRSVSILVGDQPELRRLAHSLQRELTAAGLVPLVSACSDRAVSEAAATAIAIVHGEDFLKNAGSGKGCKSPGPISLREFTFCMLAVCRGGQVRKSPANELAGAALKLLRSGVRTVLASPFALHGQGSMDLIAAFLRRMVPGVPAGRAWSHALAGETEESVKYFSLMGDHRTAFRVRAANAGPR